MTLMKVFLREFFAKRTAIRQPEPDLVMDDPEKVAAYTRAGREDGVMRNAASLSFTIVRRFVR